MAGEGRQPLAALGLYRFIALPGLACCCWAARRLACLLAGDLAAVGSGHAEGGHGAIHRQRRCVPARRWCAGEHQPRRLRGAARVGVRTLKRCGCVRYEFASVPLSPQQPRQTPANLRWCKSRFFVVVYVSGLCIHPCTVRATHRCMSYTAEGRHSRMCHATPHPHAACPPPAALRRAQRCLARLVRGRPGAALGQPQHQGGAWGQRARARRTGPHHPGAHSCCLSAHMPPPQLSLPTTPP